jgi:hypothetical protein
MTTGDDRSVKAGGNIIGSQVITGDGNTAQMRDVSVQLTTGQDVNLAAELAGLREALNALSAPDAAKIERALQDAEEEAGKDEPDKEEVGSALERAIKYAKNASDFGEHASNIAKHLGPVVSWLGSKWTKILALAGISF